MVVYKQSVTRFSRNLKFLSHSYIQWTKTSNKGKVVSEWFLPNMASVQQTFYADESIIENMSSNWVILMRIMINHADYKEQ